MSSCLLAAVAAVVLSVGPYAAWFAWWHDAPDGGPLAAWRVRDGRPEFPLDGGPLAWLRGPGRASARWFDLDFDGDVDLRDIAIVQQRIKLLRDPNWGRKGRDG